MFWMRNKENNFPIHAFIWRPEARYKGQIEASWLKNEESSQIGHKPWTAG